MFEYLVQDNLQEHISCQRVRDPSNQDQGKALEDEQEHILEVLQLQ